MDPPVVDNDEPAVHPDNHGLHVCVCGEVRRMHDPAYAGSKVVACSSFQTVSFIQAMQEFGASMAKIGQLVDSTSVEVEPWVPEPRGIPVAVVDSVGDRLFAED